MQPQPQMVLLDDRAWPVDAVLVCQQRDDVACAGFFDGLMQPGEGTDVNHGISQLSLAFI